MMRHFEKTKKPLICFSGPLLGKRPGWVNFPAEMIGSCLEKKGYLCLFTSSLINRYLRACDIIFTVIKNRRIIDILCIQVYGEASFLVEDIVSRIGSRNGHYIIMVLHGGTLSDFASRNEFWFKRVLQRAHCIITPSQYLGRVINQYGFQARIIPNPIDITKYPFKMRWQIKPRLLWMRTFQDWWNPELALLIFANLLSIYPHAQLTMAGQDKGLLGRMKKLASKLGVIKHVRFPGFLNEKEKIEEFSRHDIFINTNRLDNMPVTLLEAAACGLPIVTTAVGGIPDMFDDDSALLVNEDVDEATEAVIKLLKNSSFVNSITINARKFAEKCDIQNVITQWGNVLTKGQE